MCDVHFGHRLKNALLIHSHQNASKGRLVMQQLQLYPPSTYTHSGRYHTIIRLRGLVRLEPLKHQPSLPQFPLYPQLVNIANGVCLNQIVTVPDGTRENRTSIHWILNEKGLVSELETNIL